MGVRGLTTFIANRSRQYLESYELHDCYLVIDGNSIASQLYQWHCRCNDCFGGDYDKYADVVTTFYKLLSLCGITPFVIFDGAYEKRKIKTVYSRMKNRIGAAKRLNSVSEGSVAVFPLFLRELFADITLMLKVKCIRCDFEGDSEAAHLARNLNCPLLSYDSDFYIFDVLYIPFSTMDLRLKRKNNVNYIACDMYNVDKFLNSFGGLDKINLPLLAVLLGNDYIKRKTFSHFYRYLKMQKSKHDNEQQRIIKSVIVWLKSETPESALRKILGRYKQRNRKKIADKIRMGINGYQCSDSQICSYFEINLNPEKENIIIVPDPDEIETPNDDELSEDDVSSDDASSDDASSDDASLDEDSEEEHPEELQSQSKHCVPLNFQKNYTKCLYPPCFMDMIVSHTYYCIPQVEDYSLQHSHSISLDILAVIYKILTFPNTRKLICVARGGHSNIKRFSIPNCNKDVPKLSEIENMSTKTKRKVLLKILSIKDDMLSLFPSSWHLFLISLKYWVTYSKSKIHMAYIISLILCGIILNYVDSKIGFYRASKSFLSKYGPSNTYMTNSSNCAKSIMESLEEINVKESVSCMHKLIHYFQMDAKMKSNIRLYEVNVVHQFAEFQSCLLHIKYLNALLNFPFPTVIVSNFYDGTFLYNMTSNLSKRTDVKAYVRILLENCPKILNTLELMIEQIEAQISPHLGEAVVSKRRRRRKKCKNQVSSEDDMIVADSEEDEFVLDPNNIYSLLSVVNK